MLTGETINCKCFLNNDDDMLTILLPQLESFMVMLKKYIYILHSQYLLRGLVLSVTDL